MVGTSSGVPDASVSMKELEELYPNTIFYLTTEKDGRKITGYTLDITPVKTTVNL